jgi:hypothetical protein
VRQSAAEPSLGIGPHQCHFIGMSSIVPLPEIDGVAAETAALAAAVAAASADRRGVPHEEMRAWLLEIAAGNFDAPPLEPRLL